MIKRNLLVAIALSAAFSAPAQVASTTEFTPSADFQWKVNMRHDYSHTLVSKLFLCQSCYDGKLRMRDNGKKDLRMNLDECHEAIKAMDAISLGMSKVIYLVGWQYNGHDSKYPAFFEGNTSLTRPGDKNPIESLKWLMREGKKYHTAVSLHINLTDCYPDSPLFDEYVREDVIARDKNGKLMESAYGWGYKLSYVEEYNKGLLQKRVDSLCHLLPISKAGTIHVDAFIDHVPQEIPDENGNLQFLNVRPMDAYHGHTPEEESEAQRKIIKYFDDKGIDVTTEWFSEGFPGYISYVYHYYDKSLYTRFSAAQLSGGDDASKYADLFGHCKHIESIFIQQEKSMEKKIAEFKDAFCLSSLKRDFLNHFDRIRLTEYTNGDAEVIFSEGVRTTLSDGVARLWQNEVLLAEGENVFIPARWVDGKNIIAYSHDGYEGREWTLPAGFEKCRKAIVTEVTADGETKVGKLPVRNGKITLSVKPSQMLRLRMK